MYFLGILGILGFSGGVKGLEKDFLCDVCSPCLVFCFEGIWYLGRGILGILEIFGGFVEESVGKTFWGTFVCTFLIL